MTLRIPTSMSNRQALEDLNRSRARMAALSQQLTSGNRITNLAEDPTGSALLVDFQDSIDRNAAVTRQIDSVNGLLQSTTDNLTSLNDGVTRLLEVGQQGLNGTLGASGRANLASEVDGTRTNFISIGNTQVQGKYIFAGSRTTTVPFTDNATHDAVTYQGNGGAIPMNVGTTTSVDSNVPGNALLFGPGGQGSSTDLMKAVTDLRDGLKNNDQALIKSASDNLKTIQVRLSGVAAEVGGRQATLNSLKEGLATATEGLQSVQTTSMSVDYASAITQYTTEQTGQQATLKIISKINGQTLFDFLS